MSWREFTNSRALPWAAIALCAVSIAQSAAAAPTLAEVAKGVNVDVSQISVSGISSGGFMAHQFHVAHSDHIMGAGIVAGGPYYCAKGNILDAVTRCSSFVMLECKKLNLDPKWCKKTDLAPKTKTQAQGVAKESFREAKKQEAAGNISTLTNLADDKIYLFSGEHDAIVPEGVMTAVYHFYVDDDKAGVDPKNIDQNADFPAPHTMVRDDFKKPSGDVVGDCPRSLPPPDKISFIDDCTQVAAKQQSTNGCICPPAPTTGAPCPPPNKQALCTDLNDVDLAGAILRRIYGGEALKNKRKPVDESEVVAFDQRGVFDESWTAPHKPINAWLDASMAREAYLFIPKACKEGKPCKLHVAFHGCLQGGETDKRIGHSGNLYSKYAGYNEWATANDVIVLYPQVRVWNGSLLDPPVNPQGCWDWWGQYYTHEGYYTKRGRQIRAVAQMINILAGGRKLLDVPPERP